MANAYLTMQGIFTDQLLKAAELTGIAPYFDAAIL
jgi:hypothetical protein